MRLLLLLIAPFCTTLVHAQTILAPARNIVDKNWVTNHSYQMIWYITKDTARYEIGKTITTVKKADNKVTIVTQVVMKQAATSWVDSTVADEETFSPIKHSSYNGQRNMVLNFGQPVTGYYTNNVTHTTTQIYDSTHQPYFDSNLYPSLIAWLPLKEGYQQEIAIYDYNPNGKTGVIKATIQNVQKGVYQTKKSGARNVWVVTVADEIGAGENGTSVYYIDMATRTLWKQEIHAGERTMLLELTEA